MDENAGWDRERLAIELPELSELLVLDGLDVSVTGFAAVEIDQLAVDFDEDAREDKLDPAWADAGSGDQSWRPLATGVASVALR